MKGYQARAMLKGLAVMGGPSSLAGIACGFVHIERNVSAYNDVGRAIGHVGNRGDSETIVTYTIASIAVSASPKVGQTLAHSTEGVFRLDRLLDDNGAVRRFIVTGPTGPVPGPHAAATIVERGDMVTAAIT